MLHNNTEPCLYNTCFLSKDEVEQTSFSEDEPLSEDDTVIIICTHPL